MAATAALVMALQTIMSRNLDPFAPAVVTVGGMRAGDSATAIPDCGRLDIGVRSFDPAVRDLILERIRAIAMAQAAAFGCSAEMISAGYRAGFNTAAEAEVVAGVATFQGQDRAAVWMDRPFAFSEDFADLQAAAPSCFFGLGAGDVPELHDRR